MSSSAAAEGNASSAADPSRIKDPNSLYRPAPSSLSLQMMVYFSHHYTPFFFAVNICLFTYKGKHSSLTSAALTVFLQLCGTTTRAASWAGS